MRGFEGDHTEDLRNQFVELFTLQSTSRAFRKTLDGRLSAYTMMQLLPEICEELTVRPLAKPVTDALHELRKCRNSVLHRGAGEDLTASRVGELLAAAMLGVAFIRYIESRSV